MEWHRRYDCRTRSDIDQEFADFRASIAADLDPPNNCRGTQINPDATQEDVLDAGACLMRNKSVR
jgi:hypothetical protein